MAAGDGEARVLADRYVLSVRLGSGGAGTVWRGHDQALDRPVAVKLLHADLADDPAVEIRFRTEATAAAKLTHPNAVLVYDLGRDGGDDYLVMELVEGASLADLLQTGPLPAGLAAAVTAMVAGALGTAHRVGIVHRDVKPANVLVTDEGAAKLADFGIARALGEVTSRLTRTGTVLGTARYLAPEQLRDDPIDARADVYALGLVLHETLTGRSPFGEGNPVEVAARRLTTTLPAIRELVDGVPAGLEDVVRWATALDPRERPEDGTELAAALRAYAAHDAATALAAKVAAVPRHTTTPEPFTPVPRDAAPAREPVFPAPGGAPDDGSGLASPDPAADAADHGATRALPPVAAAGGVAHAPEDASPAAPAADRSTDAEATTALATGGGGGGGDADAGADTDGGGRRGASTAARWVLGAVAALAIGLIAVVTTTGGDDTPDGPATTEPNDEDEVDPDTPLTWADAGDHDPQGDEQERTEDVPLAFDGDDGTFWPSETYTNAELGNLKDGVGIWLQLEDARALDRLELTLTRPGGSLELWIGEGPPEPTEVPSDWGQLLGEGEITADDVRFPDLPDVEIDTVVLWFTELPAADSQFRIEVVDVRAYPR